MNRTKLSLVALVIPTVLGGCAGLPQLASDSEGALPPKVSDITMELQCEILVAVDQAKRGDPQLAPLALYTHVVSATITLQVVNDESINPSLSYIHPIGTSGNNFTTLIGGGKTDEQTRTFSQTFSLAFDRGSATEEKLSSCRSRNALSGLRGNLGIREIIASGLPYLDKGDVYILRPISLANDESSDATLDTKADAPGFGSEIDFAVTYNVSGGPNWSLTHFQGPSSSGLFGRTHKATDSMQLSFTRVSTTGSKDEAEAAAAKAAKDNLSRQILQRLLHQ